jgi:phenylalanyl-tRNA synthetase alpha chain
MLKDIKLSFGKLLSEATSIRDIESIRVKYLGKSGLLTEQMKKISSIPADERREFGASVNTLRDLFIENISALESKFEETEIRRRFEAERIDITLPPRLFEKGKIHPLSKTIEEIKTILIMLGFEYADGPDIEDDWHNFTALNIGPNHPARQMQDTFYLKGNRNLLRTHTSNVQIRTMQNKKLPFRFFTTGKTYRSDYDATHSPMFHQLEVCYIDKDINMGHLKSFLETFLKLYFNVDQVPIRLRPSYFPFTEPSAEVDVKCDRGGKNQIKIGQGMDWLEILGCGMVHPNVLRNCNIDPDEYQGFAVGAGIERLAMLKCNIPDLRDFFESDIRWLNHYGF